MASPDSSPSAAASTADEPATSAAATRAAVLANGHVRRFLVGFGVSNAGTALAPVALSFAVLDQGGDAGDIGLVLTAESVPLVGGGGPLGPPTAGQPARCR